ncbi:MAG: hypothetical protein ACRDPI_01985 [Nocardioidaceae bacterium]
MRWLAAWLVTLVVMALALVGTLRLAEVLLAAVTAAVVLAVARVSARDLELPQVPLSRLRLLRWLPMDLLRDTGQLLLGLRHLGGLGGSRSEELVVPPSESVVAVLLLSASPGLYVIDLAAEGSTSTVRLHAATPPGRIDRELLA